jgi:PPM family protein phosphatase
MQIITAQRTNPGGRKNNEDYSDFAVGSPWGYWVVADGLGGHGGGEEASRSAVETILAGARNEGEATPAVLRGFIESAHHAIRAAQRNGGPEAMRTTVALLASDGSRALWAHVGDSRIYHFRGGQLMHQTADHSVPQLLADAGDISRQEIRSHADRSRLLRALGQDDTPQVTVLERPERLQSGDAFLLCSDGWWEHVTEVEMLADLAKAADPEEWLDRMMDRIFERVDGQHDNYTAIGVLVARAG